MLNKIYSYQCISNYPFWTPKLIEIYPPSQKTASMPSGIHFVNILRTDIGVKKAVKIHVLIDDNRNSYFSSLVGNLEL